MSDPGNNFERRVTEALESGAEQAPDATGLAAAARERNRRRVRARTTGVVAATVLAVAAVSVTVALGGGDGSRSPSVVDTPSSTTTSAVVDPDSRVETFRDLEITVPSSWGYGSLATWCLNGKSAPDQPVVERPGGAMPSIGCTEPESGYGAQFFDASFFDPAYSPGHLEQVEVNSDGPQTYPAGSWLGYQTDASGDLAVIVVAPTEAVAGAILDSASTVTGADANGCAVRRAGAAAELEPGTVSVCRYAQDGWLEQSERLGGDDATAALAAIEAARSMRDQRGPGPCDEAATLPGTTVLLGHDGDWTRVTFGTDCVWDDGVFVDGDHRVLTPDVMYWALSPGYTGGFTGDVPLPDRLRGQEGPG